MSRLCIELIWEKTRAVWADGWDRRDWETGVTGTWQDQNPTQSQGGFQARGRPRGSVIASMRMLSSNFQSQGSHLIPAFYHPHSSRCTHTTKDYVVEGAHYSVHTG